MNDRPSTLALLGLVALGLVILQVSGAFTIPGIQHLARKIPPRVRRNLMIDDLAKNRDEFAQSRTPAADRIIRITGGAAGLLLIGSAIVAMVV